MEPVDTHNLCHLQIVGRVSNAQLLTTLADRLFERFFCTLHSFSIDSGQQGLTGKVGHHVVALKLAHGGAGLIRA